MKKIGLLIPFVLILLLILLFKTGLGRDPNLLPSMLVNKSLPPFKAISLADSKYIITDKQLRGRLTLLNVWATWCATCQIEHPILVDLAKSGQLDIIGLNYRDERNAALAYLSRAGNPYRACIFDPKGQLAVQFGVYGTPESFLIDSKGIVRYRFVGPITLTVLSKELLPRIKQIEEEGS